MFDKTRINPTNFKIIENISLNDMNWMIDRNNKQFQIFESTAVFFALVITIYKD